MRFAIPPTQISRGLNKRNIRDWPLALRFALLAIPCSLLVSLVALWLGYHSSAGIFQETLESVPLIEAKIQAHRMSENLNQLRQSLVLIAKNEKEQLHDSGKKLEVYFHENIGLVQEFGFKDAYGGGFVLLRDKTSFNRLSPLEASLGPYSPFQQITSQPIHPGAFSVFPPVFFDDPTQPIADAPVRTPVMRVAMALQDGSGTLILGINMLEWRNRLSAMMQQDSPLRLPIQQGALQLAFFFDPRGWILFEMGGNSTKSFFPDLSREGYGGDLGRTGYDAAFRPWAVHENYWAMVTQVTDGRSGSIPAPADKYLTPHVGSKGLLAYAPVTFSAQPDGPPAVIGGIAFFETSPLPLSIFMRLANYSLAVFLACLLLFGLITYKVHKKAGKSVAAMAVEIENMTASDRLGFITAPAEFNEQRKLASAINAVMAGALNTRKELANLTREMHKARERLPVDLERGVDAGKPDLSYGLVGSSSSIQEVREHIRKAAKAGTDVLVWGETGTGKELVAAAIHKASVRKDEPYISINCGALDENLLLDALFGHVKGAFSEAKSDRKGAFLAADGGTLHLDEIANASPKVQQSLLRALSVRRIRPLGTDQEIPFTTRVVAATNVDLREGVRSGAFREDLYYRLTIISIETPPLRHRKEDLPELAACFIQEAAASLGRSAAKLSRGALDLMYNYDWPGNVREFKNCITRAMAFAEGDLILPQHVTLEADNFCTYTPSASNQVRTTAPHDRPGHAERTDRRTGDAERAGHADRSAQEASAPPQPTIQPARPSAPRAPAKDRQTQPQPASGGRRNAVPGSYALPHASVPGSRIAEATGPPYPMPGIIVPGEPAAAPQAPQPTPLPMPLRPLPVRPVPSTEKLEGLNERQLRGIDIIQQKGEITRLEYEFIVSAGLSSRTAQNDLRELVDRGILRRIGAGPGTRYRISNVS